MTLNANFPGAVQMTPRGRLEGPERGLDALVGLVILLAEVAIGLLSIYALFAAGNSIVDANPGAREAADAGLSIALFGSGIIVLVTTIVYLARVVAGRRSWRAPLWGTILMSVALVVGYVVMSSGA
jgi:hypothetical protein